MENNPYNLRNLPQIMRGVRKSAGLAQYQIGNLIGERINDMFLMWKMALANSLLNYALSGLKYVKPMNILISCIIFPSALQQRSRSIDPALNESASAAVINMVHQLEEALEATKHLARWLASDRPGRRAEDCQWVILNRFSILSRQIRHSSIH